MSEYRGGTYRVAGPSVGNHGTLLVHTHHLLHVIKARVTRHLVVEGNTVLVDEAI